MKRILLVLALFVCPIVSYSQQWRDLGSFGVFSGADDAHMTVLANGKTVVAFRDASLKMKVRMWTGANWQGITSPTVDDVEDIRLTSAGDDFYIGFNNQSTGFYEVYKYESGGWTMFGDLSSVTYLPGMVDLDATELSVDQLNLVVYSDGTNNATVYQWDGFTWVTLDSDFLTSTSTLQSSFFDIEDNNANAVLVSDQTETGPPSEIRFYKDGGGAYEQFTYFGGDFIISDPLGYGMDATVGSNPYIAATEAGDPVNIYLYEAEMPSNEISDVAFYETGDPVIDGALDMSVTTDNYAIVVFTTSAGSAPYTKGIQFNGSSWDDLGSSPMMEFGMEEIEVDIFTNSNKPYFIYRTDGGQVGVKTLNNVPTYISETGVYDVCEGSSSLAIENIEFNDSDHDSLYLSITSSAIGIVPNANISYVRTGAYEPSSSVNGFDISVDPISYGTVTLYIDVIDGLDTLNYTENITVNASPAWSPSGFNPTTCGGTEGYISLVGLSPSHTYSIDYDDDGAAVNIPSAITDASGMYDVTGLDAGNYDEFYVTDGVTGCVGYLALSVPLNDPSSPVLDLSTGLTTDPTTCGGTDGVIVLTGMDVFSTYDATFDVDGIGDSFTGTTDGNGFLFITGRSAGTHNNFNVTHTTTLCEDDYTTDVVLNDPAAPVISAVVGTDPTSCGGSDGEIIVSGLFAGTNYNVSYDEAGTGTVSAGTLTTDAGGALTITSLTEGTYDSVYVTLVITGCSAYESTVTVINLNDPAPPTFTAVSSTDPTTCGATDGTILLNGLSPSYTYNISYDLGTTISAGPITSTPTGDLTIPGLGVGTYDSVLVVDPATTCGGYEAVVSTFVLNDPAAPVFSATVTDPSLCGGADGTFTITGLPASTTYANLTWDFDASPDALVSPISNAAGEIFVGGTFTAGTIENIQLEDLSGCTGSDAGPYDIINPAGPTVDAGLDLVICEEEFIVLNAGNPDDAVITWDNGIEDGVEFHMSAGTYVITATATAGVCSSIDDMTLTVHEKPFISMLTSLATCGSDDGAADATISGGLAPYEIYWSNGETTEDISGLSPTAYYMNVVDDNGCYSMEVATIELTTLSVGGSGTNVTCNNGSDGAIDLTVSGTGPFTHYWSNGETTEDITGLTAGQYEVFVTDGTGCLSTSSFMVTEPDPIKSTFSTVDATCGFSDASISATVSGGTAPYTYAWEDDGGTAVGIDDPTLSTIVAGTYTLNITDSESCSQSFMATASDIGGPEVVIESITPASCSNDGAMDITATPLGTAIVDSYAWSSGEFTEDASSKAAGFYSVQVMDDSGCMTAKGMEIPAIKPDVQQICIVGVDTATNTNRIVWEKPVTTDIDHYDIYRESSVAGLFQLVNSQDYAAESFFVDSIAYPQLRSWRYKMKAVNSCGIASDMSIEHKTIHIVYEETTPGSYTLDWDAYEGFAYGEYNVWRFLPATGWELLVSQSTALPATYFDTPPSTEGLDYIIEVVPPSSCTSTKATDHNSSRSNKSSHTPITPGGSIEDLSVNENPDFNYSVYPNPSTGIFNVTIENNLTISSIGVYDLSGKYTFVNFDQSNSIEIDLSDKESGVYILEIVTEEGTINQKLIKE